MKIIINICLLIMLFLVSNSVFAQTITFEEAYEQTASKPMAVLIYADWADDYENHIVNFRKLQNYFNNTFNFVELDIASKDAKAFNEKYEIYPKLPYIILLRNNGKVSRYIPRNCALDSACVISKMKAFIL